MKLEWKNCGSGEITRGSVVRLDGVFLRVVWTHDSKGLVTIPISGDVSASLNHPSVGASLVGELTAESLEALRCRFAEHRNPTDWVDEANSDADAIQMPSARDGWQVISESDGTYWRLPAHAR